MVEFGGGYVPPRLQRRQPPRHHPAAQVHRAAGRIEVRLRHLHRHPARGSGLGAIFTEGCSELDWVKRVFDSSDLPDHISWKEFCRKGYYVVPPEQPELRQPVDMRWFAEGRTQGHAANRARCRRSGPRSSAWACRRRAASSSSCPRLLKRHTATTPSARCVNRYIPSWEGPRNAELAERFPLQMIATHSPLQLPHQHATARTARSTRSRTTAPCVAGHRFWLLRLNPADAAERGIAPPRPGQGVQRPRRGDLRGRRVAAGGAGRRQVLRSERRVPARSRSTARRSRSAAA